MKLAAAWLDWPEVKTVTSVFAAAGYDLRFVGGAVRDTILGREVRELDAASNARPQQMLALLEAAGLRAIPTGIEHGTVTVAIGGRNIEITTLRKDVATDGRHAEVAFGTSWEEDAARRDFTMNALYLAADGTLYDFVGGLADCNTRTVKFIGDPTARIREDYLRILRYFRFVATLGNHRFDEAALVACAANKEGINRLSGERIAQELLKLLAADESYPCLDKMQQHGLLDKIFPGVHVDAARVAVLDRLHAEPLLKLAALLGDAAHVAPVAARLKLSSKQSKLLACWLGHCGAMSLSMEPCDYRKLIRAIGNEAFVSAAKLFVALSGKSPEALAPFSAMAAWQAPEFPVTAKDLLARGYTEGKALGDKLRELEKIWEESGYAVSKKELIAPIETVAGK